MDTDFSFIQEKVISACRQNFLSVKLNKAYVNKPGLLILLLYNLSLSMSNYLSLYLLYALWHPSQS